jgi:hypothetical protein
MIKANELRIGNLVKCNNPEARPKDVGTVARVIAIDSEKHYKELKGTVTIQPIHDEYAPYYGQFLVFIDPIPITPSILIRKFGFRKSTFFQVNAVVYKKNHYSIVGYDKEQKQFYVCGHDDDPFYGYFVEIKYVHQLQNLIFALTGEEPDITF